MKKSNFKKDDEALIVSEDILPGVNQLFQYQRGTERSKRKANGSLKSTSTFKFTAEKHEIFDSRIRDELNPDKSQLEGLLKSCLAVNASQWSWLLSCNFNLFLFGVGTKRKLIERFITQHLDGVHFHQNILIKWFKS
jgi:hypothetical protein